MSCSFTTDDGVVVPTVSVAQMREVDRIAIGDQAPNIFQMMENAGRSLAGAATRYLGRDWPQVPITVFVGTGGNGGGGVVAARHLANRGGDITVVLPRVRDLGTVLEQQLVIYSLTSGRLRDSFAEETGLILDALIGYGLTGEPSGVIGEMIAVINGADAPVISLDVPSGLDGDTGCAPGAAVLPTQTLTLALPKTGLGADAAGDIWLADLGIPVGVYRRVGIEPPPRVFERGPLVHLNRTVS